jgi:NADH:flavin oxidoreductase / NADH oxidase family/NAD(P)-binding Rossmann-like domain
VKNRVSVPVIAVGRLGHVKHAEEAVATGKADFVALGRSLIADPEWVVKLARNEPPRRCLACNTCVNEMRGGAALHCVVNAAAGEERRFESARPPMNERIAVIGGGPAGLTYASLVAERNAVTVFERAERPGGAFRYAGKAPLFQDVVADQNSFDLYIDALALACAAKGVSIRYHVDVTHWPELLRPFDRIVVATGAAYRFGLGPLAMVLLDWGVTRWPLIRQILSRPSLRDWFYHRARSPTGAAFQALARPGQEVTVIGDALAAGKSRPAIASAFEAALRP